MQSEILKESDRQGFPQVATEQFQPRWYAVYTSANHEKRVALELGKKSVEHFLPLYNSVRRWKDRRMSLQLPLFPGYLFVHLPLSNRLQVLQVPGVVSLVGFNGAAAALPEEEINALKESFSNGGRVEPHPYLAFGRKVRIRRGPLEGWEGILIRRKGAYRVVLSVELIMRSIVVDIDLADLELRPRAVGTPKSAVFAENRSSFVSNPNAEALQNGESSK